MRIVHKKDVARFLKNFQTLSSYDELGKKEYFVFRDKERNGQWTLMYYRAEDKWTIHGKGKDYCDKGETTLSPSDLEQLLYKNRRFVNDTLRNKKTA